ncbi:MAG: cytochrome c-type biogenesis protein [Candidatus Paceibacteria bacterium]|jgi:cytochrome c-type biogenesis protein
MEFLPISFLAGILTILAPCVLPLLPVIIGGSVSETTDKKRPLIITLSLAASVVVFTLLLKATTALIDIPQDFWKWFSASIVFLFAISLLFPNVWPAFSLWFKKITKQKESFEHKSQKVLFKFYNKKGFWPAVVLGAALGPVFASCSPTYFLILGTVLPASFFVGLVNLIVYALGLALVMFAIAYAGQRFTKTLNLAANPKGWFKKSLGVLFMIVAIAIVTGYDKKLEAYILDQGLFDVAAFEQRILDRRID